MDISNTVNNTLSSYSALENNIKHIGDKYGKKDNSEFIVPKDKSVDGTEMTDYRKRELERLQNAADDFEAILINQMFKSMRQTINKTELMHGGTAEDIFEDMLYDEYSKEFSKTKKLGISEMIFEQMKDYI